MIQVPVSTKDFYPALLNITGSKNFDPIDGQSLHPMLKEENDTLLPEKLHNLKRDVNAPDSIPNPNFAH
jgi:hypothetical protein